MNFTPAILAFLVSASAFANTGRSITLDFAIEQPGKGKALAEAHTVVMEGEPAVVEKDDSNEKSAYRFEVTPKIEKDGVRVAMVVKQKANGEFKVVSRPAVVVRNGETATVESNAPGFSSLKLRVTPSY